MHSLFHNECYCCYYKFQKFQIELSCEWNRGFRQQTQIQNNETYTRDVTDPKILLQDFKQNTKIISVASPIFQEGTGQFMVKIKRNRNAG